MDFRDITNPVWANAAGTQIDCVATFLNDDGSVAGTWPFTADPSDCEAHGREIVAQAAAMGPAPYVAPPPVVDSIPVEMWRVRAVLERRNLLDRADAAVTASGDPVLQAAWHYASEVSPISAGLKSVAEAIGLTNEDIPALAAEARALTI